MRFRLIWVGRTRNEHLRALADDYLTRLSRFTRCTVVELRESALTDEAAAIKEESKRIGAAVASDTFVILLDITGERRWSSAELAATIQEWESRSLKEVTFVVGGHLGVADEIRRKVAIRWSLSPLTLTHEMARVLMLEQLYRAYTIAKGLPYQK